ncbi:hypothetical protein A3I50_04420 [Candidatus Roizmanbacteria bacterium RIFCSPLOWO2_02_FULL_37_9]|nr:MAG: hypothetical protein A3I50_04420 [Candidatus Roizmanbacteria bacterium RIFCSPLOWO2_02_FULL_37_9]
MIKEKIIQDQIVALKNHEPDKLSILRYILAKIKNKEIEKKSIDPAQQSSELTDDETIMVLRKIVKELNESIEAFEKGKREDLVSEYQKQLEIVSFYLPKELSDEELKNEIKKIIDNNRKLYEKNPKAIIGICIKELKSKADPTRIVKILNSLTSH